MSIRRPPATLLIVGILATLGPRWASGQPPPPQAQPGNCATCHSVLGIERLSAPVAAFADDIHASKGFGCVSCHGGDATAAGLAGMDPAMGFIGVPSREQIPQLCGRCHSNAEFMRQYDPALRVDQVVEYVTSVHGQRLTQFGDTNVATCANCHPAHSIKPASDPNSSVHPSNVASTCGTCHADPEHMQSYGIPTDQLEQYSKSVHWQTLVDGDLSAPTCNDCHGNHGAAPPGVSWVGNVCGQCHVVIGDAYAQSLHAEIFTMLGAPGCATCHSNHDIVEANDAFLGLGEGAVCARCHVEGAGGGVTAAAMRSLIDSLHSSTDLADSLLSKAENAGVEVSQAQFELQGAQTALIRARTAVHTFDVAAVEKEVAEGLDITRDAQESGLAALAELRFRRMGLAISSVIIGALVLGLILRIREIERRQPTT